jgi:hypothetical protein
LSQGAREGRDLREYNLDKMWGDAKGLSQFVSYAQNIVDRRMKNQDVVPVGSFTQCLRDELVSSEIRVQLAEGIQRFRKEVERHQSSQRYLQWLARAEQYTNEPNVESLVELYVTRILLVRDASKRQMSLDLTLTEEELEDRDSSQVRAAAELFMHEELGIPYYFGFDRLCVMATNNVEELLALSAALYVGLQAKQVLRKAELICRRRSRRSFCEKLRAGSASSFRSRTLRARGPNGSWIRSVRSATTRPSLPMRHMLPA